ncbi:hypothetical protein J421_1015 [Gemmatirosa kalamazoonensis]|uniref:Uncharacterized protein n=1 Tax=Gemmatirosa kalamazoonensis TaxID=861299 RepID=W0RDN0_9BACT|nr:hypothetical protein [Gemmatirosa kalamazoonensis]AHG88552.1 hypothetical protein J421_1015 [Gemmatirosa kalamazoonensis]
MGARARDHALPEARALVERFVAGAIDLATFRQELDRRAKSEWRALALRGPAGAMVLNQLAKHADADSLAAALRAVLPAPPDAPTALERLRAWVRAATALVSDAPNAAPGRLVAFAAACWHVQAPERWPAYHPSARAALAAEEGLFAPTGDAPSDYLAFRHAFLALAAAVGIGDAQLERLCRAHAGRVADDPDFDETLDEPTSVRRRAPRVTRVPRVTRAARVAERPPAYAPAAEPATVAGPADRPAVPGHTQVQWLLARLGRALGCRVWIAANDHARTWEGEALGTLSLPRLPRLGLDDESERLVRLIDVVWISGRHRVAAAFEVERTTSVHSGILRMADLAALAPNLSFPMYVVAPRDRLPKVRRELARPSLQALGLGRRCGFFSAESLVASADAIARFGGGPAAIERLAERVSEPA